MKPVDQRFLTHPEGDCFAACLASILELPLGDVPNFKGDYWRVEFNEWLLPRGLAIYTVNLPEGVEIAAPNAKRYFMPGYTVLAAQSPRFDCLHAVVCFNGEIVHDPHPMREQGVGAWEEVDLLVTLDASYAS